MYNVVNGEIRVVKTPCFDISEILECGQCFRFEKITENEYKIIAYGQLITVKQDADNIFFMGVTENDFKEIWQDYFDLENDYEEIKRKLSLQDDVMRSAIDYAGGIRILNQEPWECLISFIISQNNRIPQIKQVIKNISERYGSKICDNEYAFPTPRQLIDVSIEDFMKCKAGFRSKYIRDAVIKVYTSEIDFEVLKKMETDNVRKNLMNIMGVGPKVSDCIMLFSMGRREVFPVDVWIGKIMRYYYFNNEEAKLTEIHKLAQKKYGAYAGYAQQYLFHYARSRAMMASDTQSENF